MKMKIGALLVGASLFAAHSMAATTQWRLLPSSKYDSLCLTTIVANDPYTTQFYGPQREALLEMLPPDAVDAATRVNQAFKDAGVPVIGWLSLVYSAGNAETLDAFGSRVLGSRFIMDVVGKKDPFRSVGAGAPHEMTHPPFDRNDPRMASLVAKLENDPVIHGRWLQRPTNSGYNTFAGYIDEDVTRALDQIIGERVGVTFMDDADARWREQEGGFHMAAAVFYHLMKEQSFLESKESVADFLDRMHRERRLEPAVTARIVARVEGKKQ